MAGAEMVVEGVVAGVEMVVEGTERMEGVAQKEAVGVVERRVAMVEPVVVREEIW